MDEVFAQSHSFVFPLNLHSTSLSISFLMINPRTHEAKCMVPLMAETAVAPRHVQDVSSPSLFLGQYSHLTEEPPANSCAATPRAPPGLCRTYGHPKPTLELLFPVLQHNPAARGAPSKCLT